MKMTEEQYSFKKENTMKLIEYFLSEHRTNQNGDYAQITPSDLIHLRDIVWGLIELKCDTDMNGSYPIKFILSNKLTHTLPSYQPVPRIHSDLDKDQIENALRVCIFNLNVAHGDLDSMWRLHQLQQKGE